MKTPHSPLRSKTFKPTVAPKVRAAKQFAKGKISSMHRKAAFQQAGSPLRGAK